MRMRHMKLRMFISGLVAGMSVGLVSVCLFVLDGVNMPIEAFQVDDGNLLRDSRPLGKRRVLLEGPEYAKPNDTVAVGLQKRIRILCWLYLRNTENFARRVNSARGTWGGKCTRFLVFITQYNKSLDAIGLDKVAETTHMSDSPIISINRYIYKTYYKGIDWFFSADSIPFVIMENLRYFLMDKDPDVPAYYGHRMRKSDLDPDLAFPDRCSGTVLSKAGLQLLCTKGNHVPVCDKHHHQVGVQFAVCMHKLGVTVGESRDSEGRSRFLMFDLTEVISATKIDMGGYMDDEYSTKHASGNISPYLISFGRSYDGRNTGHHFFIYDLVIVGAGAGRHHHISTL